MAPKPKKQKVTLEYVATEMVAGFRDLRQQMVQGFDSINGDMKDVKQRLTKIERDVSEIKIDLKAHGKAIDKDAVMLIKHHNRISRLEKLVKR